MPDHADGATPEATQSGLRVRLRSFRRLLAVLRAFLPLFVGYARDRRRFLFVGGRRRVSDARRRRRAEYLKATLVDLGPTFIKFGQILSTRPDVLPRAYVDVLSTLQDRVPPDPWTAVEPVVEAEVGPPDEAFDDFAVEPISGASLGQVYTATLDGERVAVKVLRPNIRTAVEADLRVIATLLPVLVRFAPPGQAFTLENLAEEFADTIRREMDYAHEAAMLRRVGANLADESRVRVPAPVESHSTDRVLTMEYVDGVKIDRVADLDAMGVDRDDLVRRLEEVYIGMIVEDGLFHADPHPGNLAVQSDGTIVFYDFGMCGFLDERTRGHLLDFYVGVATDDIDRVIDAFVAMGALDPDADRDLMREVFDLAFDQFRGEDVSGYRVRELVAEFESQLYDFPLRLPQNLALIVRVTTVLEGVARTLDPEFDFLEVITEYVMARGHAEKASVREDVEKRVVADATATLRAFVRGTVNVPPNLERVLDRAARENLDVNARLDDREAVFDRFARRVVLAFLTGATALSVTTLFVFVGPTAAAVPAVLLPGWGLLLYRSLRTRRGIRARPQFTRQAMRQRRGE